MTTDTFQSLLLLGGFTLMNGYLGLHGSNQLLNYFSLFSATCTGTAFLYELLFI